MKVPRVSVAWIVVFILLSVIGFFGYHIFFAVKPESPGFGTVPQEQSVQGTQPPLAIPVQAPVEKVPMPKVPAQTEEDLRADEPLRETPPDVEYGEPQYMDPLEGPVHSVSEFGDNLRHPEQMIEVAPPLGTSRIVPAGLGSEESAPGGNRPSEYAPEMAQNGGEFMSGIMAFDLTDGGGIGYSMI